MTRIEGGGDMVLRLTKRTAYRYNSGRMNDSEDWSAYFYAVSPRSNFSPLYGPMQAAPA
jgi:hypothetical protein